jgi:serine-type D-Ala-D-Ala carboxypeptidase (penicillin-binding protein 5/6)
MRRKILASFLLLLALCLIIFAALFAFTPLGDQLFGNTTSFTLPTRTSSSPGKARTATPVSTPQPVLTAQGTNPTLTAKASYLMDMDTGNMLEDVNGEETLPMASTTKIMTALIAIQSGDINQTVTVPQDAIDRVGYQANGSTNGSSAFLQVGETIKLKDLLYGLLLPSGDDAAVAIADDLGGTQANFVQRMNLFAYRLHLFQTHYTNPDGLTLDNQTNPDHYTTAADLAHLAAYAMKIPFFAQIVSTPTYSANGHLWQTTNDLLLQGNKAYEQGAYYYTGTLGIKTGHTVEAGYCLVFAATRNGHRLLGVVLGSPNEDARDQDATALLNWGFALPMLPSA